MKALGTLLLLLQLGPLAGPVLCLARPHCGMPQHAAAVSAPGSGGAGMDHPDCWVVQACGPATAAVLPAVAAVDPVLEQHPLTLPADRPLLAGIRAAPLSPPPRV